MKKIKTVGIVLLLIPLILGGYLLIQYYQYIDKQSDVREFQTLAFKGYTLVNARKNSEAIKAYEEAIEIYDKDDKSLADLAMLYRMEGDFKKAAVFYDKAYRADNDNYKHLYNSALMDYLLKNHRSSIDKLTKLIHLDKPASKYYKFLALNYAALKDNERAMGYSRY